MFLSLLVFQSFSLSELSLRGNWVDLIILVILLYYLSEAWRVGFWVILASFFAFFLSLLTALSGYSFAAELLRTYFSLARALSNALGFLIIAGVSEGIFSFILSELIRNIPYKLWKKPWSNLLATLPALGEGLILVSFFLTLIIGLPLSPKIKADVSSSKIGGFLITNTAGLERKVNEVFGGIIEDSLTYLTVTPGSKDSIPISVEKEILTIDQASETQMFNMVNSEREKRGIGKLTWRSEVLGIAREHAKDMWERSYFGHYSPEGEDVGDRLDRANISYRIAGENLALAPTLQTAHNGLMNSEGHRANILDTDFKRMGIGVIDNGVYGKMFVQVFTD